ncbi:MAG: phosphotransferase [Deltaproteobacteria bacterium]|nr:phosphotransferase [Deltaproteobacteria bacterium]
MTASEKTCRRDDDAARFASQVCARLWPGAAAARSEPLRGDASTRRYLRAHLAEPRPAGAPATLILMVMQDAAVALSSEELGVFGKDGPKELAFVNVARFLSRHTDALPTLYGVSPDQSLLVLEDVGDKPLWDAVHEAGPAEGEELFGIALDLIADLQARAVDDGSGCYAFLQAFDERLFGWEFQHFLEYGVAPSDATLVAKSRAELAAVAARLASLPRVLAHRDYHAWNIHVQAPAEPPVAREAAQPTGARGARLRLIDFQDALLAPALYDVASLLTDRMTPDFVTPEREARLLQRFFARQRAGRLADLAETRAAYRLVALQRVLKVVGRFNYLAEVKGKPSYLAMLPAVCRTARRLLAESEGVEATRELFSIAARDGGETAA